MISSSKTPTNQITPKLTFKKRKSSPSGVQCTTPHTHNYASPKWQSFGDSNYHKRIRLSQETSNRYYQSSVFCYSKQSAFNPDRYPEQSVIDPSIKRKDPQPTTKAIKIQKNPPSTLDYQQITDTRNFHQPEVSKKNTNDEIREFGPSKGLKNPLGTQRSASCLIQQESDKVLGSYRKPLQTHSQYYCNRDRSNKEKKNEERINKIYRVRKESICSTGIDQVKMEQKGIKQNQMEKSDKLLYFTNKQPRNKNKYEQKIRDQQKTIEELRNSVEEYKRQLLYEREKHRQEESKINKENEQDNQHITDINKTDEQQIIQQNKGKLDQEQREHQQLVGKLLESQIQIKRLLGQIEQKQSRVDDLSAKVSDLQGKLNKQQEIKHKNNKQLQQLNIKIKQLQHFVKQLETPQYSQQQVQTLIHFYLQILDIFQIAHNQTHLYINIQTHYQLLSQINSFKDDSTLMLNEIRNLRTSNQTLTFSINRLKQKLKSSQQILMSLNNDMVVLNLRLISTKRLVSNVEDQQ